MTIQGAQAAQDAARDWQAVRADGSIQYAPVSIPEKPVNEPPEWLKALAEWLEPLGRALGMNWHVLQWIMLGIAVLAVIWLVWRMVEPLLGRVRPPAADAEPDWTPDREAALALLDDADALAAAGRFDEAAHLLLRRSVQHIAAARPDWVHPASTARELAALPALPDRARSAFALITARVERSRYALRALDAADWHAAREAYAAFALERIAA